MAGSKGNRPFDPAAVEPLQVLAKQAAVASEHSRLYAAAQPILRRSLNLEDVYPAFAAAVKALLAYDRIGVVVPEGDKLVMALSVADPPLASWKGQDGPMRKAPRADGFWPIRDLASFGIARRSRALSRRTNFCSRRVSDRASCSR